MWLVLIVATLGTDTTAILNGSGGTLQTSSGDWSLCKHAVTPIKPSSGIACQTISNFLVGKGGSDWVANTLSSSVWGCWTSPPSKLWLQGFHFRPLDKGGIHLAATTSLEGVEPSPNQGTDSEASSPRWVPWLYPWWPPLQGGVSQCWLGALGSGLFGWGYGRFLWKSHTTEYILVREGDVALHLLPELHNAPNQKAWLAFSRQVGLLHPELQDFWHRPPSSPTVVPRCPSRWIWQLGGGRKFFQWRHSSAGGAWWSFSTWHHLLALQGSQKEACTSHANFSWLSTPWTVASSYHQPGVSYVQALQITQIFYQRFRGGHLSILLFWTFNWPLEEAVNLQS